MGRHGKPPPHASYRVVMIAGFVSLNVLAL